MASLALSWLEGCCQLYGEGPELEGRQARAGSAPQCPSPGRSLAGFLLLPSVFAHLGLCLPTPWPGHRDASVPSCAFPAQSGHAAKTGHVL